MASARGSFEAGRQAYLAPALGGLGFRVMSRSTWLRGSAEQGWIVVEVGGNRRNTAHEGEWSVTVWAWPRGTWEWERGQTSSGGAEPDTRLAPLYASPERVLPGTDEPRPDVATFVGDMPESDVARETATLVQFVRAAVSWVEEVLADGRADNYTWPGHVLGAAESTGAWTPARLRLLDVVTARAQRGEPKPAWSLLASWRVAAGLDPVPFPPWHHPLMDQRGRKFASPRAAFEAGHGAAIELRLPDGSMRAATPQDFPDRRRLRRWRREATPTTDVPLRDPPSWLPWHAWLHDESESTFGGRR